MPHWFGIEVELFSDVACAIGQMGLGAVLTHFFVRQACRLGCTISKFHLRQLLSLCLSEFGHEMRSRQIQCFTSGAWLRFQ